MNRSKILLALLALLALSATPLAEAQQAVKVPRIGYLGGSSALPFHDGFRGAFQQLGYREGENVVIDYRWSGGSSQRAKEQATELLQSKVDVIVAVGPESVLAARDAVHSIPIVFALTPDPVRNGLVESLARPGRNMTGLAFDPTPTMMAKVVELLREAVPKISRLAIMGNPNNPGSELWVDAARQAAKALNLKVQRLVVRERDEIDSTLASMRREHAEGLVIVADQLLAIERVRIINFANQNHIPSASSVPEFANAGSLLAYGSSPTAQLRRAAYFVDKILRGAKPADLPVEQPTTFDLILNLKTAKVLGLTIPPSLLMRADRVIE